MVDFLLVVLPNLFSVLEVKLLGTYRFKVSSLPLSTHITPFISSNPLHKSLA